jgi:hypothetical protein
MMLTARDRLSVAQGLSVRGSAIRHFEELPTQLESTPTRVQVNELPPPRPGHRLVELERRRREQLERGTLDR